jgi:hypothetical protein
MLCNIYMYDNTESTVNHTENRLININILFKNMLLPLVDLS